MKKITFALIVLLITLSLNGCISFYYKSNDLRRLAQDNVNKMDAATSQIDDQQKDLSDILIMGRPTLLDPNIEPYPRLEELYNGIDFNLKLFKKEADAVRNYQTKINQITDAAGNEIKSGTPYFDEIEKIKEASKITAEQVNKISDNFRLSFKELNQVITKYKISCINAHSIKKAMETPAKLRQLIREQRDLISDYYSKTDKEADLKNYGLGENWARLNDSERQLGDIEDLSIDIDRMIPKYVKTVKAKKIKWTGPGFSQNSIVEKFNDLIFTLNKTIINYNETANNLNAINFGSVFQSIKVKQ